MSGAKSRYRAVFISDLHLGAAGSKADCANDFLMSIDTEYLYLVGDIIDGWVGSDRKFGPEHTACILTILHMGSTGTKVFYTPGNHDDFARRINGSEFSGIKIDHSFTHAALDGRDFLVVHGDLFDRSVSKYRPLAKLGAYMGEFFSVVDKTVSKMRAKKGKPALGFGAKLKTAVKKYIATRSNYEMEAIEFGRDNGFDAIVCGHVHRPIVEVFEDGFTYYNTGDWVQHCTALVEHLDGAFELITVPNQPEGAIDKTMTHEPLATQ